MKKKIILSSMLVIVLCLCVVVGSTFALFTDSKKVNIAATAADLDVSAAINKTNVGYKSLGETEFTKKVNLTAGEKVVFANGGTAKFDGSGKLILDKITPGDAVSFTVTVTNESNVAVKYTAKTDRIVVKDREGNTMSGKMLSVKVFYDGDKTFEGQNEYAVLQAPGSGAKTATFTVVVEFENADNNNDYQGCTAEIDFIVEIVQYNGVDANGDLILP